MYKGYKIGVVIPCYNEETQIGMVIETMPDIVDYMIIVDDKSSDATLAVAGSYLDKYDKIILLKHEVNRGVGGAISTGYIWCRNNDVDIAVVMAGDGQMNPDDLPNLLDPVASGEADYAKGNRLYTDEAWKKIPKTRYLGNSALSLLTKIASGYWHVADSQTGYTALNRRGLEILPIEDIYPRYGMPNDLLITLNIYNMSVVDVPITPVYGVGEKSGMHIGTIIVPISLLIMRLFCRRIMQKYIIRNVGNVTH